MIKKPVTDSINVALGADDNYALPLAVTICSILKNVKSNTFLHIFILDGGITDKSKKRIERVFAKNGNIEKHTFEWVTPSLESIKDLPTFKGRPLAVYLPLLIPDLLPETCNKVIFLDCDLILDTDIQKLWASETEHQAIWAVRDVLIQKLSDPKGVSVYRELGGREDSPYFNSGVLLINLELWRKEDVSKKAIHYLRENRETMYHCDQEALNAVFIDRWGELDPRWNQQGCIFWPEVLPESDFTKTIMKSYNELINNPFIVHYLSPSKPWHYKCMHPEAHKFLYYLKESGWFTKTGWALWWNRFYFNRFKWLLGELRETLIQVKVKVVN